MATILLEHRALAPHILCDAGVMPLSIVDFDGERVVVSPFEKEICSTVYTGHSVAILRRSSVDEFLLDDIELLMNNGGSEAIAKLDAMFRASDLYYSEGCDDLPSLVSL